MHIGVFDVLNKVLFQKLTGDVSKKALFSCGFLRFFCICFQSPYFLVLAFPFVGFEFLCFFSSLVVVFSSLVVVVVSQIKFLCSGFCICCCWWVSWVCLCVMCCVFLGLFLVSLVFFFFGGFKGQVRWPKGPPRVDP